MAGNVKGIIVEIGGDTSGLQKALNKVNSTTSSLSKELRGINSLLKLDPKNTELLEQKQKLLNDEIAITSTKLKELKQHQEDIKKSGETLTAEQQKTYRALQREIIKTENELKKLQLETSKWTQKGKEIEEVGAKVKNTGTEINKLGSKLTTTLTLPLTAIAAAGITYNAQIEKYTTAFKTFLGDAKEAEKVVNQIKEDAAKTPFDVSSLIQANQMLISTGENANDSREVILALGDAVTATGGGNEELSRMAANLQQIKNAGQATALDIKQFAYAGIDIYGLLADYTGKTTAEVKDMTVSYEVLTKALQKASKQGGKYYNAMNDASETLTGQTNKLKAEMKEMTGDLTKSLMPIAKKIVDKARELISEFNKLSDAEKENIVKIGLMVAAAGPLVKIFGTITTTVGGTVKGIGTFVQAIGVMKTGAESSSTSVNTLAKVLSGLTSPAGIAAIGITAAVAAITIAIKNAEKDTKEAFENMGNSASDFITGIDSATSHLDSFNSTLFATSEEQQKLQDDMNNIQKGITDICKKASDERRGYTQEEITQLDEYFTKLRELKNREIEIQNQMATAITQQAVTNAQTFQGSLDEYKVQSQEWIKTATEQKEKTVKLIEEGTIEEVALLNQRYTTEEQRQSEEYQKQYNEIMRQKQAKIDLANSEVAEITQTYANGYLERSKQNDGFYTVLEEYNKKVEEENNRHNSIIEGIENNALLTQNNKNLSKQNEEYRYNEQMKKIWKEMYKNMDETQEKQLGVWLAMVSDSEIYGGEITGEAQDIVNSILDSYGSMPSGTKKIMKETMDPMLTTMQEKEPSLYAKATNIANGILNRLKKAFDIHSPSKKVRKIFNYAMEGAELGFEDRENILYKQADNIVDNILKKFSGVELESKLGSLNRNITEQTRNIFTTPQITFNVQKLDEANLEQCFNYINRKFGSSY